MSVIVSFREISISTLLVFRYQDEPLSKEEEELKSLKESLRDTQPLGVIINCCRTLDQVRLRHVLHYLEAHINGAVAIELIGTSI